jgi:hypothetical protein
MRTEAHPYRDYEIDLVHNPPGWQANIYQTKPVLPSPNTLLDPILCESKEEALAVAQQRIDRLLK